MGLAALLTAQFYSPESVGMIDVDDKRLEVARQFGATTGINGTDGNAVQRVMDLTAGLGVDVAIEAVGVPATFDICQAILAPGGKLATVGVHGCSLSPCTWTSCGIGMSRSENRLVDTATNPIVVKRGHSDGLQSHGLEKTISRSRLHAGFLPFRPVGQKGP